ncbi:Stk1 family PASTA domain-containing Ser/Thr kinase [Paenibacillus thiaminolyticus]|uniref:Serine/threonine-protein kinase PrkC n=1 Tax=Paenibacillus thiaminolyticus TaxID=49283 RepID=A0AAP9J440_PANTH|nr:Stk1 family PASTA domain-containing Ser/Thr kinase [Paenibacillus thiaminolyticus]MCY9534479.1 Stk1 family PASTA domain-containing Ser/Thr kinase [Paenibacillus thiaminolyticus]MCY9601289.1 Stk1 family PASTA domain-containing Ser/Thr kinase [Paenibacillus thiaminolyticus]MCY9606482.1 Stk1 family PASTA domain-containing Ser/Thr kinase [Paenibacillus thiaminolyticus]MCY9614082.1 Stk1 family PASTA domain-containing Ser/Thr kinase [Paenibacillus thiaminolyticus]MCY9618619.1 Stk1 family PASTA do
MIGTTLAGRYEITARIGGGGMALVYKALDNLLNRYVAVKVLRQQFVHDEEFIQRFRREAQSAASLSHPNVVSIYDVGQEDDTHYIVMEYVEGHNLNEIIQQRAPLQVEEAVRIASQICDALDHAHQNRIIHRDIKPHNILIGRNGRVKVTDFGIARAVTSSTITQTGSVVGSVHYFSPEHAKGISAGEKSDLYSLGIVLYQMLTGRLPFLGESPISVALKHLQEPFEEPRKVNPHIPQSVENIILKSMRKNPAERYQSAAEMLRDLETSLSPDRAHEAKVMFAQRKVYEDPEETRVMPAIRAQEREERQPSDTYPGVAPAPAAAAVAAGREPAKPAQKGWVKPTVWIGATLLFLGILIGVVFYVKSLLVVKDVVMPNVIKMTEQEALNKLAALKIEVEDPIVREPKEGFEKGVVFEQSKPEGTRVKEGSSVRLYVSEGTPYIQMDDYTGKPSELVIQQLIEIGFDSSRITKEPVFDDEAEPGTVVGTTPAAGEKVDPRNASVKLLVSKGKETFGMPNLVGATKEEAIAKIEASGLKLAKDGIIEEPSYEQPAGRVFKQQPFEPNDPVSKGSEVRIYVSSGYPPEALRYTFPLPVAPEENGKTSTIRIVYTDATGENKEWGTQKITSSQIFYVELVLAPNKDGVVLLYRDGQFLDTYTVSYTDAKQGTVQIPPVIDDPSARQGQEVEGEIQGQSEGEGEGQEEGGGINPDE